jgi:hypothetical protein
MNLPDDVTLVEIARAVRRLPMDVTAADIEREVRLLRGPPDKNSCWFASEPATIPAGTPLKTIDPRTIRPTEPSMILYWESVSDENIVDGDYLAIDKDGDLVLDCTPLCEGHKLIAYVPKVPDYWLEEPELTIVEVWHICRHLPSTASPRAIAEEIDRLRSGAKEGK